MAPVPPPVQTALICVSDKSGIVDFAQELHKRAITILSTGGSAKVLKDAGIPVREVSEYTGSREIMGGRVKTLHPLIHGGILARRGQDETVMQEQGILPIDLVVVNLYPFEEVISDPATSLPNAIENIDIGGPAMIRAAAKNYKHVTVAVEKADYQPILAMMKNNSGGLDEDFRYALALKAFEHTARYDGLITNYLANSTPQEEVKSSQNFPQILNTRWYLHQEMRYGENPHQKAAFYVDNEVPPGSIASARQLQGKELSYNNIADVDAALTCVQQFDEGPACVIVKHTNPCGVSVAGDLLQAFSNAYLTDPESAFGGIIAFNRELDGKTAKEIINRQFVEVIAAPAISRQAQEILATKEKIRVLASGQWSPNYSLMDYKSVTGGMLVQETDSILFNELAIVTERKPDKQEMNDLNFAWKVVRMVKSNAIVYARENMTIGIGAGQMSRITSSRIAAIKASKAGFEINGAVMASDAFIPFSDSLDHAADVGITAVIQPGGSIRDDEVIEAANKHGLAMVFTGTRHFRH